MGRVMSERSTMLRAIFVLLSVAEGVVGTSHWLWPNNHGELFPPLQLPNEMARDKVVWGWFEQKLDHFKHSDTRRWKQRYVMNDKYGVPSGPGFLQFGGEGPTNEGPLQTGAGNDPSKMVYLSSKQALADTAAFIKWAEKKYNLNKWIVFGGSYAGGLTAWMRLVYPDVVLGAVASSGTVQAKVDFREYYQIAGNDLKVYDQKCFDETQKAFDYLQSQVNGDQKTRDMLGRQLNVCHGFDPNNGNDVSALFDSLSGPFMTTAQYGGDNRVPYDLISIPHLCQMMMDTTTYPNLIDRLLAVKRFVTRQDDSMGGNWMCDDNLYEEEIRSLKEMNSQRGWNWQACTEFGKFQSTDGDGHPFGKNSPLKQRLKMCELVFGLTEAEVYAGSDRTNAYYGGQIDYNATNVVLVSGSQDPWHVLNKWKKEWELPGQTVIHMPGQPHCSDMYPDRINDTTVVQEARKIISQKIGEWLQQES